MSDSVHNNTSLTQYNSQNNSQTHANKENLNEDQTQNSDLNKNVPIASPIIRYKDHEQSRMATPLRSQQTKKIDAQSVATSPNILMNTKGSLYGTPLASGALQQLQVFIPNIRDLINNVFSKENYLNVDGLLDICSEQIKICCEIISADLDVNLSLITDAETKERLNNDENFLRSSQTLRVLWYFNLVIELLGISFPLFERVLSSGIHHQYPDEIRTVNYREIISLFEAGMAYKEIVDQFLASCESIVSEIKTLEDQYDEWIQKNDQLRNEQVTLIDELKEAKAIFNKLKQEYEMLTTIYKERDLNIKKVNYKLRELNIEKTRIAKNIEKTQKLIQTQISHIEQAENQFTNIGFLAESKSTLEQKEQELKVLEKCALTLEDKLQTKKAIKLVLSNCLLVLRQTDVPSYLIELQHLKEIEERNSILKSQLSALTNAERESNKLLTNGYFANELAQLEDEIHKTEATLELLISEHDVLLKEENNYSKIEEEREKTIQDIRNEVKFYKQKYDENEKAYNDAANIYLSRLHAAEEVRGKLIASCNEYVKTSTVKLRNMMEELQSLIKLESV